MKDKTGKSKWRIIDKVAYKYPFKDASEELKLAVWEKGTKISGRDPAMWRKDIVGNLMKYPEHGDRNALHGWEMDHIIPPKHGGSDKLPNLQPLHWKANEEKGDKLKWPPKIRLGVRIRSKTKRPR